ncbi:hypothetical protein CTA1_10528 [Colletotrichum tanaceti]|uniref:Major facilitator superfamily (MFS) profile domain-containing protein n=1 Tax=Colletotrichum tanaceti TaxID=1306861 RepID=A0A4U6XA24_9PEZI|nr:hypothetical protein CTA1_10528 [Colletotrichum tanaceti]
MAVFGKKKEVEKPFGPADCRLCHNGASSLETSEGAILGLMNAVYPLGKVVTLFVVTYVGDRWGRKLPLSIELVGCIAFAVLLGLAKGLPSFSSSLQGYCWASSPPSSVSQAPVVITKLAYPTQRGRSPRPYYDVDEVLRSNYSGFYFAAWCTFGTFKIASTRSWRVPSLLQTFKVSLP